MRKNHLILIPTLLLLGVSSVFAATSYRLSGGTAQCIKENGIEQYVNNTCAQDVFVPTKTAAEWNAFISFHPACVKLSSCTPPCWLYQNKHTCAQCTARGGTLITLWSGDKLCGVPGTSCGGGWTRYPYYGSCSPRTCSASAPCGGLSHTDSCSVPTAYGPQPGIECSCTYRWPGGGNPYGLPQAECVLAWCTSTLTGVACY